MEWEQSVTVNVLLVSLLFFVLVLEARQNIAFVFLNQDAVCSASQPGE